ncbi:MAG: protein translocase subunit SecF [Candidatus Kerfeldbacteria bacterium]|nr:protein translocase subunit SecF [Candidatus Kerfeldbacteria bacterium]
MFKIIHKSKYFAAFSIVLFILSVTAYGIWGLRLGIDFTGGASLDLSFSNRPTTEQLATDLSTLGFEASSIVTGGDTEMLIKFQELDNAQKDAIVSGLSHYGATEVSFVTIGPSIGEELKQKSILAIGLVLAAIIVYISYAFRRVSKGPVPSWVYGIAAIVALAHDIFIPIGVFALLGHFAGVQIDALFVTALLTILGFSVHDTIVVFDRIREGLKDRAHKTFAEIVNISINTTLARSINTSVTTLIVLTALYVFGGTAIHWFVFTLILGIICGTYSSIFIASPVLLLGEWFLNRKRKIA